MEVEHDLPVVDFTTEKDFNRPKKHKKRKRVGNSLPIGEKVAKHSELEESPSSKKSRKVIQKESDDSEIDNNEISNQSGHLNGGPIQIETSKDEGEQEKTSTFSGALASLLGQSGGSTAIMTKATKPPMDEEEQKRRLIKKLRDDSREAALQRKLFKNRNHKIPDFSNAEFEARLRKVATRGIVKLFNAIKSHQRTQAEPVGIVRSRTEDSVKSKFLQTLKSNSSKSNIGTIDRSTNNRLKDRPKSALNDDPDSEDDMEIPKSAKSNHFNSSNSSKSKGIQAPSWEVLRDDYMLGAKMKDWDKDSDNE